MVGEAHEAAKLEFKIQFIDPDYKVPIFVKQQNLRKTGLFDVSNSLVEAYDEKTKKYYPSELVEKSKYDGHWTIRFNVDSNDGEGTICHNFPETMLQESLWVYKNNEKTTAKSTLDHDNKFMEFVRSMVKETEQTAIFFKLTSEQNAMIIEACSSHHATERVEERIIFQEFQRSMKSAANRLAFRQSREGGIRTHVITTTTHLILSENLKTVITVYLTKKSFSQWHEIDRAQRYLKKLCGTSGEYLISEKSGGQKESKAVRKEELKQAKKIISSPKAQNEIKEAMINVSLKMSQENQSSPRAANSSTSSLICNTTSQNLSVPRSSKNNSYMYTVDIQCEICGGSFKLTKDEQVKYITKNLPLRKYCKEAYCCNKWKSIQDMNTRQRNRLCSVPSADDSLIGRTSEKNKSNLKPASSDVLIINSLNTSSSTPSAKVDNKSRILQKKKSSHMPASSVTDITTSPTAGSSPPSQNDNHILGDMKECKSCKLMFELTGEEQLFHAARGKLGKVHRRCKKCVEKKMAEKAYLIEAEAATFLSLPDYRQIRKMAQKSESSDRLASTDVHTTSSQNASSSQKKERALFNLQNTLSSSPLINNANDCITNMGHMIECRVCKKLFEFTRKDQLFFTAKGWCLPKHCKKTKCLEEKDRKKGERFAMVSK